MVSARVVAWVSDLMCHGECLGGLVIAMLVVKEGMKRLMLGCSL